MDYGDAYINNKSDNYTRGMSRRDCGNIEIRRFTFECYCAILPYVLILSLNGAFTMEKGLKRKELGAGRIQRFDGFYVGRFIPKYSQRKQKLFRK